MANSQNNYSHMFSIELTSKNFVKRFAISSDSDDKVLIEGYLGELKEIGITEGVILEIQGTNGILRIDLTAQELSKLLSKETTKTIQEGQK